MDERMVYIVTHDDEYRIGTVDDVLDARPNQEEHGDFPVAELMTVFADIVADIQDHPAQVGARVVIELRDN